MKNIMLVYIVTQLLSTAYGIAVIESVKPVIEKSLEDKGYVLRNKNSLYRFNNKISNILKGFIPFYYAVKATKLVRGKNAIERAVNNEINSGEYNTEEQMRQMILDEEERKRNQVVDVKEPEIVFEKPEKYTARKNDYAVYDTYETPIEYITHVSESTDELSLTPFMNDSKVVEHVMVKDEVTKEDIAKAITELDAYELELLKDKIAALAEIKRKKGSLVLEKDVA